MSTLSSKDLDRLTSEIASFVRSGMPVPGGLAQLNDNLGSGNLKNLTSHLATATAAGQPLSDALSTSPVRVPASYAALVRCGEISGDLGGVLNFALEHARRVRRHRGALTTMFIYPMLVIFILLAVLLFAMVFLLPRFLEIFEQVGAALPTPTRFVLAINGMVTTGPGTVVVLLFMAGLLYLIVRACQDKLPGWMLNSLAGAGDLVYLSDTAIMTEFVGHLVSRGVPMPEACRAASLVVYQSDMRFSLELMAEAAEQGQPTAQALNPNVPATAAWLYRQGEARGTVPETCRDISEYCENRFDILSRRTLQVLEPLFILLVSFLCAAFLISLYLPLFNIPKIIGAE